jgi:hypothetical protein
VRPEGANVIRKIWFAVFGILVSASAVDAQVRIVSAEKDKLYRAAIPVLEDQEASRILKEDTSTVFYSIKEMPRTFQFAGANGEIRTSFHWSGHNFSGDNDPMFHSSQRPHGEGGNANVFFPWRADVPGGTHRCANVTSYKAMWLPKKDNGQPWPIVWFHQNLRNPISGAGYDPAYGWIYPIGTRFFEVLVQYGPSGYSYVFEIRERRREATQWEVEIHRPFPTAASMAARIMELKPDWEADAELSRVIAALNDNSKVKRSLIRDRHNNDINAFHVAAGWDSVPEIKDDDLVGALLTTTPFKYSNGETWKPGNANSPPAFAASFEGKTFNVVPAHYDGTFLGTDQRSCMKCHESTNVHARLFSRVHGWYGYVGGSDGIISHTIADPRYIRADGANGPVQWRDSYVQAGMVERYEANRHPNTMYRRIQGLH